MVIGGDALWDKSHSSKQDELHSFDFRNKTRNPVKEDENVFRECAILAPSIGSTTSLCAKIQERREKKNYLF